VSVLTDVVGAVAVPLLVRSPEVPLVPLSLPLVPLCVLAVAVLVALTASLSAGRPSSPQAAATSAQTPKIAGLRRIIGCEYREPARAVKGRHR
jgi:hypothetical protein